MLVKYGKGNFFPLKKSNTEINELDGTLHKLYIRLKMQSPEQDKILSHLQSTRVWGNYHSFSDFHLLLCKIGINTVPDSPVCCKWELRRIPCDQESLQKPWLVQLSGLSVGCEPKGRWVDSQSVHMPGLWVRSPVGGRARGNHTLIFLSLSPSLPLSLKINK